MAFKSSQSDIFSRNLKVLAEFHPHVRGCLDAAPPFQIDAKPSESGILNLYIGDEVGNARPLYPSDNPVKDVPGILDRLSNTRGRIVCLMGFGLGYHAEKIIEHIGAVNIIVLYEAHPAILKEAMRHLDLTRVFSHRHVRMVVGHPVPLSDLLKSERDILFAGDKHIVVEMKKITALSPEWYETEKDRIRRFVQGVIISNNDMAAHGKRYFENRFRNLFAMSESIPLGALTNKLAGKPAIIVASGPSLSKNIEQLKNAKGKAIILAGDSAVAPMLQHGIMPDIVVSVDINDYTFEKLAPFADRLQETGLLFIPEVTPKIPNYINFGFKIFTLLSPYSAELFNGLLGTDEKPLVHAQSVIHLALGAAQRMGCDPIIFTGLDLAYDNLKDHADGTILHWGNHQEGSRETDVLVEGIHGEIISSNVGLLNILETCRKLIRGALNRTYIDATEGGAKIDGTKILPLAEVIERYCGKLIVMPALHGSGGMIPLVRKVATRIARTIEKATELLVAFSDYRQCAGKIDEYMDEVNVGNPLSIDDFFKRSAGERKGAEAVTSQSDKSEMVAAMTDIIAGSVDEYIDREVQVAEAESSGDAFAVFCARKEKQRFVQEARERVLQTAMEILEPQRSLFDGVQKVAISDEGGPAAARFLFEHSMLARAEILWKAVPDIRPEKQFYLGAINIRRGDIENGLLFMNRACDEDSSLESKKNAVQSALEKEWCVENIPEAYHSIIMMRWLALGINLQKVRDSIIADLGWLQDQLVFTSMTGTHMADVIRKVNKWAACNINLPEITWMQAVLAILKNDLNSAIEMLEKTNGGKGPDHEEWMAVLGFCLIEFGRVQEGMAWYEKACAIDVRSVRCTLQRIWRRVGAEVFRCVERWDIPTVNAALKKWVFLKNSLGEWHYLKAFVHQAEENLSAAVNSMESALSIQPDRFDWMYQLGNLRCLQGEVEKGGEDMKRAISLIPDGYSDLLCFDWNARLFAENGDYQTALDYTEEILSSNPSDTIHRYRAAFFCLELGRENDSLRFLEAAIVENPNYLFDKFPWRQFEITVRLWPVMAKHIDRLIHEKQMEKADRLLGVWEKIKDDHPDWFYLRSLLWLGKSKWEEAVESISKATRFEEENPEWKAVLGRALIEKGEIKAGLGQLLSAIALDRSYAVLLEKAGDGQYEKGDYMNALLFFEHCLRMSPENAAVLKKIGDCYSGAGSPGSAKIAYSMALTILKSDQGKNEA